MDPFYGKKDDNIKQKKMVNQSPPVPKTIGQTSKYASVARTIP
jgi:hypothetical protein